MNDLKPRTRTEQLPNPFRPRNGVPPRYLAGRDRLLGEAKDRLVETPPLHANWALTGLRGTGTTVRLGESGARAERAGWFAGWLTLERELGGAAVDRGLVYRPTRGTYDFALPLFGAYLRRRAELTELTRRR